MWDTLPDLVIAKVFGFLDQNDRVSASEVCVSWGNALCSPTNWRTVQVRLDRDLVRMPEAHLTPVEPLVIHLARLYGHHMRNLELIWPRPMIYHDCTAQQIPHKMQAEAGANFFFVLKSCSVQLEELVLTDWVNSYKWPSRNKLLQALIHFLSSQDNLEKLSLYNACLGLHEVVRLITGISLTSPFLVLKKLDLRVAFREWNVPHVNPRFLDMFSRLKVLTVLDLDYPSVSDATLKALSESNSGTLSILRIDVRDTDNRHHVITNTAWALLVAACPKLQVGISISMTRWPINIAHFEDICYLLLPSIPLYSFRLFGGTIWDQSRSRNFRSTMGLILAHFTSTLEDVILQMKNNREAMDDLLIDLVASCRYLTNLQYDGIIRSMETVHEICLMQVLRQTNFHAMHFRPRFMSSMNCLAVEKICSHFTYALSKMKVDFKIEDYPSILMYT